MMQRRTRYPNRQQPRTAGTLPAPPTLTACQTLTLLQGVKLQLAMGQAVAEVETPQLGRVVFSKADPGELQRQIDYWTVRCNIENGMDPCAAGGRKPFSFYASDT